MLGFKIQLLIVAPLILPAVLAFRRHGSAVARDRRYPISFANRTLVEDPAELQKRDGTKYVFMHHDDWKDDIQQIQAKGVDALALNIGSDSWQRDQVRSAYAAALELGGGFKLFFSFDLTEMACDLNDLVGRVNEFGSHPNQFKVNGKTMVSSYSGDCLGDSGWASLKAQTNAYLMPFIWGLEGQFNNWPSLDSWYCWGCAWPQGNYAKSTSDDDYYINQLGTKYATTVSGWLYTHFSYKNFYLRGDDWLVVSRWEQLMTLRDTLTFVEMVTWNDYGESDYYGPIKGAQPSGTTWANGFPHTAFFDLSEYYIRAFKTGSYPAITKDVIYYWARPHPASATASSDGLGKPTGWDWTEDSMWAAVFATSSATVTLKCGSSSQTFTVNAGVNKLKIPLAAGQITVTMVRNGQTVINKTPTDFTYVTNPTLCNTTPELVVTTTSTSSSAPTSSSTTTTTSPTSTGWTYLGCYQDYSPRTLANGLYITDNAQTVAKCQASCAAKGYTYAGTEYGVECFCSNTITAGVTKSSANECNMPCSGKSSDICGGGNRISIYQAGGSSTPTTTTSSPSSTSTSFSYYGCVAEGSSGSRRALTGASYTDSSMTPQKCQSLCSGFQYAGISSGYCGNSLANNGATGAVIPASGNCYTQCGGDSSQTCGGAWTLSVYSKSPPSTSTSWSSAGCYADSADRMLRGWSTSQSGMTTDKCIGLCSDRGFSMAATEYGVECYCGSQLFKASGAGVPASSSDCSTPCDGDSSKMCGGGWRGNLYTSPGTVLSRRHKRRRAL
ncbi:glycosyl hydrolase family 71-domain-containing protein [Cyathus striatus]|nr:glycosyl hydrolase family 71-domain-containing protein [Cyathus striatus]